MFHVHSRRCWTAWVAACLALTCGRHAAAQQPPSAPEQRPAQQPNAAPIDDARRAKSGAWSRSARPGRSSSTACSTKPPGNGARGAELHPERSARRGSRRPTTPKSASLYDDEALYFGVFAKDDEPGRHHRQRPEEGLQHRRAATASASSSTRSPTAQRLPVRDQPGRREVGRADVERGAREQQQLGRHLGRARRGSPRPAGTRRSGFRSGR